jgi:site-specific recombinase XerD
VKYPAEPLTDAEVRLLIGACGRKSPTGKRNRAMLALMYRGGLRCGELLALFPKDIADGEVRILHGKGDESRTVGLDPGAWAILDNWLQERRKLGFNGHVPLFCTLHGRKLNPTYLRLLCPRLAKKAGIEKRVHPHGLRHSCACRLVEECVPLNVVSRILGHKSVATTNTYINHIKPADVLKAMKDREWSLKEPANPMRAELLRLKAEIEKALAT